MRPRVALALATWLLQASLAGLATAAPSSPCGDRLASDDEWFCRTEQALMDAVGRGDRTPWERVTDPSCTITTEEGEVVPRDPPAQAVSSATWATLAGTYRLLPNGWTFRVELRDGTLYGGRNGSAPRPFVPLAPEAFVLSGSVGEWLFVREDGRAVRIVNLRKFATLVWTRLDEP